MRRSFGIVTAVLLALAAIVPSAFAQDSGTGYDSETARGDDDAPVVEVDFGTASFDELIAPGTIINFEQGGFQSLSTSVVEVQSTPRTLGFFKADEDGVVKGSVKLPEDLEYGDHTLVLSGVDEDGDPVEFALAIEVGVPSDNGLADFVGGTGGVVAAIVLVSLIGAYLVRRRQRESADSLTYSD